MRVYYSHIIITFLIIFSISLVSADIVSINPGYSSEAVGSSNQEIEGFFFGDVATEADSGSAKGGSLTQLTTENPSLLILLGVLIFSIIVIVLLFVAVWISKKKEKNLTWQP